MGEDTRIDMVSGVKIPKKCCNTCKYFGTLTQWCLHIFTVGDEWSESEEFCSKHKFKESVKLSIYNIDDCCGCGVGIHRKGICNRCGVPKHSTKIDDVSGIEVPKKCCNNCDTGDCCPLNLRNKYTFNNRWDTKTDFCSRREFKESEK